MTAGDEAVDAYSRWTILPPAMPSTRVRLVPRELAVQTMEFETSDAAMRGEMTSTCTLTDAEGGTLVEAVHEHLPPG